MEAEVDTPDLVIVESDTPDLEIAGEKSPDVRVVKIVNVLKDSDGNQKKQTKLDMFFKATLTAEEVEKKKAKEAKRKEEATAAAHAKLARDQAALASKRTPGRPRKLRFLVPSVSPVTSPDPSQAQPADQATPKKIRRNWFAAPKLVAMILRAVKALKGFLPAVKYLQIQHPDLFMDLRESTVRDWYKPLEFEGEVPKLKGSAVESLKRQSGYHKAESSGIAATLEYPEAKKHILDSNIRPGM